MYNYNRRNNKKTNKKNKGEQKMKTIKKYYDHRHKEITVLYDEGGQTYINMVECDLCGEQYQHHNHPLNSGCVDICEKCIEE